MPPHDGDTRTAGRAALATSAAFVSALALSGSARIAEDFTDLLHSLLATRASLSASASWYEVEGGDDADDANEPAARLPAAADAAGRRFVLASTSYFACDACYVLGALAAGLRPHQWAGRLAHHCVQAAANLPALLCREPAAAVARRYLLLAYAAEASTVLLRLRGLARALGAEAGARRLTRALLVVFAATRLIHFPYCTKLIYEAKEALPPAVWRLQLTFAGLAIALNVGWFVSLAQLAASPASRATKR